MTNDTFLIGTQYYRAPTPMPEDWESDIANMAEMGMNIIRLWLVWSWMNPAPGQYIFDDVDKILELCKKNGIKAVLLTSLEGAPAWMVRENQDCYYVSRKGIPRYTGPGANLTPGGFPGLCPDNKIVQEKGYEWIAATAKHFANSDVVYGWEPQNEPMMEGARYHDEVYCYCDATLEAFRNWLKKRYKTVDALDQAWRQRHGCWEDVTPPREFGSWPDWVDWRNFAMENVCDHIKWRIKAIEENAPNHPILMHSRSNTGALLDTNTQIIDDWRLGKLVELFGQAAFPGKKGDVDYQLSMEATRCSCPGKTWWQAELQGGGHGSGTYRQYVLRGNRLFYWSWIAISIGAKAVLYWQYRPERMGFEYGYGITDLDGSPTDRSEAVKKLCRITSKYAELLNTAKPPEYEIALAFSPNNYIIHGVTEGMCWNSIDSMKGAYRVLMHADLGADVIRADEEAVDDDYSKYKMIFLPLPTWISPKTARKLKDFVAGGGTVIAESSLAQYDERYLASTMVPGLGMDELFGVRRVESEIIDVEQTELTYKGITFPSKYYREVLQPKSAEVIGTHDDGTPAITMNTYGKGKAIYIGSNPFMEYQNNPNDGFWQFMQDFMTDAGITRKVMTDRREVQARYMTNGDKLIVFVFNHLEEPVTTTLTVVDETRKPVEIIDDKSAKAKQDGNNTQITVDMEEFGTKVYLFG